MSKINIFISHTSKDHDFVWELAKRMKKDLKDVAEIFVDDWEIKVGDSIVRKIDEAAQKADFFIIVLSKYSINQEWVKREIDIAFTRLTQKKSKILPIWLEISVEDVPPILLPLKAAVFRSRIIIDEDEYKKLIDPILNHEKAKFFLNRQESVLYNIQHLDLIFQRDEPTPQEIEFALNLIKKSPVYERYFFSKLTSLEWFDILKSEGFFSPKKASGPEPADREGLYTISYWNVLDYLERVSQKVGEPGNEKYIDGLLEIIKKATEHHKKRKKLDNYHIWSSFVRILANLPNEKISMEIIDLIPVWLDSKFDTTLQAAEIFKSLLPKFFTNNPKDVEKAERIIEHLTEIVEQEGKKFLKIPIFWLRDFFETEEKKYLKTVAEKCTVKIIEIFTSRIKELISNEYEGTLYSLYDRKTFLLREEPIRIFIYILSEILLIKTRKEPENIEKILKSFFKESHPIFTKIALFVIGQNIDILKNLFWEVIKVKGEKIFEGATLFWGDELKKILENLGPLDNTQRKLLKEKIEEATEIYGQMLEEKNKEEKEKWKSAFKQMIYKALSYNEEFKVLYEEIKKVTGMDVELRPAIELGEVKVGPGKSPLTVEKILEMNNTELAEYLIKFKTVNFWEGPTVEGLANNLRTAVKSNPQKFTENLDPFLEVGYLYVARILEGFQEALKDNKHIDYEKILDFIEKYINWNKFWEDKFIVESLGSVKHTRVITAFCFFITEGFQNKTYPLPEKLFGKVEQVVNLILKKLNFEKADREISDHIFYSLNTPLGRVIETYIKFVLTVIQSSSDKKESIIKNFIRKYKELLEKSIIEAYTFFGMYLLNFYFHIDKNFTIEIVKSLKPREEIWEAFMEGYFAIGRIYKEVYELMKEHYEASLEFSFKNKLSEEMLIEHLSLAYLIGLESLEPPSLFNKLIKKFNSDDINQIIWFFWRQKDYLKEDDERTTQIKKKILDFWQFVYDKLYNKFKQKGEESLSEEEKEILSNLIKLAVFVPELTEPYKQWLKFSAKFIKDPVTFSFFLEYLEKFMEIEDRIEIAKNIGEILSKAPVFTYPKDKIEAFIKYLCETGDEEVKSIAKYICEEYMKSGIFFLKEVCEKCN